MSKGAKALLSLAATVAIILLMEKLMLNENPDMFKVEQADTDCKYAVEKQLQSYPWNSDFDYRITKSKSGVFTLSGSVVVKTNREREFEFACKVGPDPKEVHVVVR